MLQLNSISVSSYTPGSKVSWHSLYVRAPHRGQLYGVKQFNMFSFLQNLVFRGILANKTTESETVIFTNTE